MRYRDLPIVSRIKEIAASSPEEAKKFQDTLALDLFKTPGFQLVMASIQLVEGNAIDRLRSASPGQSAEYLAGCIAAADLIRRQIVALLPVDVQLAESEAEEEVESEDLYTSGFSVAYPTGV